MTILLETHKQTKREIVEHLKTLAGVAESVGMSTLAHAIRDARIPKVENERFYLVVLGEFNHGKSTFVNALLGAEVLPTGITPTTAAINHVVWAPTASARARLDDGKDIELSPGQISDWVTVAGQNTAGVSYVEVGFPSDLLRENITLVDTPGVNDLNEARAEITYGYVPRADAVIFLLDAGQALKDSEREFLSSHVLEGSRDRLIFVLGKVDLLNAEEREAVTDYVRNGLTKLVDQPQVFPLSARDWLAGRREGSGMPELLEHLERFLHTDRAQILLDNAAADAARTAAYLGQNLGVRMQAYDLDLAELEARVAALRKQLDTSKRTLDQLHMRIGAEAEGIKSQLHLDLENFTRAFISALPEQIDAVDASDVKTYLPGFIEDKFKEFAEIEGAKLAMRLEHLAEEVITVTNENVAAASSMLANRIGPADTEVEIDVDSFKYDIGVYVVGALGTTMLFINVLAGGLLTLAAPVLAIVLKSKIAGDIREQAKERVPKAVMNASEAMRPHFDKCVDDFAERLREFVTAAGNSLYKGISEVLDNTVTNRRARSGELDSLRSETGEQISTVAAVRAAIDGLRSGLWRSTATYEDEDAIDDELEDTVDTVERKPTAATPSTAAGGADDSRGDDGGGHGGNGAARPVELEDDTPED